jgi:serine/threonine protein kinase
MLLSEPQIIDRLSHSNIVEIREAQFDPADASKVTYVMRAYGGGSVEGQLLGGGDFSVHQALILGTQLADALWYLHNSARFVHRDVKPGNLLMDTAKTTGYLSDFGSAGLLTSAETVMVGHFTLPYLDPEAFPSGVMTVGSDVYSAGLTIFEMLSGSLLPKFDPAMATVRLGKGRRAYPDSALRYAPHVPAALRRVINKAIQPTRSRRYDSAADLATALERARNRTIDWRHVSGAGLDGRWEGTWPPNKPVGMRRTYRVTSTVNTAGKRVGTRDLDATYLTSNGWRHFSGLTASCGPHDHAAVSKFFDTVHDAVAQIRAAR